MEFLYYSVHSSLLKLAPLYPPLKGGRTVSEGFRRFQELSESSKRELREEARGRLLELESSERKPEDFWLEAELEA